MAADLGDLTAFLDVARAGGFRKAARASGGGASSLSEAVRRLEAQFGVRLLNRTTRSLAPTEAGARLVDRLAPALAEVEAALDVVNGFRDRPAGALQLNVPVVAARLVLPRIVPRVSRRLSRHPRSKSSPRTVSSTCSPPAATPASATTSGSSRT